MLKRIVLITFGSCIVAQTFVFSQNISTKTNLHTFTLEGELNGFKADLTTTSSEPGIEFLTLTLNASEKLPPPVLTIRWFHPIVDVHAMWSPSGIRSLAPSFRNSSFISRSTTHAPIFSLYSFNNRNRLTFACSDALNSITMSSWVNEETAEMDCRVKLFAEFPSNIDRYQVTIRLDTRDQPYWTSTKEVTKWWETMPAYLPNKTPQAAKMPMYSTWYSFHQQLNPDSVEYQCKIAKSLGCDAVILDDGWQTLNNGGGYAYTGDWEPVRIPAMKDHVERIHKLGMKFLIWYAVPFVGVNSKAYETYKDKILKKRRNDLVLDPRFPEVRRYIIDTYMKALQEWNLDGFKLDFVDNFVPDETSEKEAINGRDYASVNEAADRLLTDIMKELKAIKPDIMIEFRQAYTGPLMRKYGNMFRAADCPNDASENRKRTIDIRLISGTTVTHSDMLMWHKNEPAESAALQLLNVIFSVPQISVKFDKIPPSHNKMLAFWLRFWRENSDVLLEGELKPENPEMYYPIVSAENTTKQVLAFYTPNNTAKINKSFKEIFLINANLSHDILLDVTDSLGERKVQVYNCQGKIVSDKKILLKRGIYKIEVPPSGLIKIQSAI